LDAIALPLFRKESVKPSLKCLGCTTHQTVALNIVRRQKATPIHELERYMRCKDCHGFKDDHSSAVIWWHCAKRRFPPTIPRQLGGRASETEDRSTFASRSVADIGVEYQDVWFVRM
jgi:hypothetical protein